MSPFVPCWPPRSPDRRRWPTRSTRSPTSDRDRSRSTPQVEAASPFPPVQCYSSKPTRSRPLTASPARNWLAYPTDKRRMTSRRRLQVRCSQGAVSSMPCQPRVVAQPTGFTRAASKTRTDSPWSWRIPTGGWPRTALRSPFNRMRMAPGDNLPRSLMQRYSATLEAPRSSRPVSIRQDRSFWARITPAPWFIILPPKL